MNDQLLMLGIKLKTLLSDEQGQDMIEYALMLSLISFGAVAGMSSLADAVNRTFLQVNVYLTTNIT